MRQIRRPIGDNYTKLDGPYLSQPHSLEGKSNFVSVTFWHILLRLRSHSYSPRHPGKYPTALWGWAGPLSSSGGRSNLGKTPREGGASARRRKCSRGQCEDPEEEGVPRKPHRSFLVTCCSGHTGKRCQADRRRDWVGWPRGRIRPRQVRRARSPWTRAG